MGKIEVKREFILERKNRMLYYKEVAVPCGIYNCKELSTNGTVDVYGIKSDVLYIVHRVQFQELLFNGVIEYL
jgi:hypothetical protein